MNFAYRIGINTLDDVEIGVSNAPHYETRVASAIKRTMQMIHGLEDLHQRASLEDIEVYLGRAGSTEHVLERWESHRKSRGHKYGTILFRCDRDKAVQLEGVAIRCLRRLMDEDSLCVGNANVAGGGGGGLARHRDHIVYMTWATDSEVYEFQKPSINLIREISDELSELTGREITREQLENGLRYAKRMADRAKIGFYPD